MSSAIHSVKDLARRHRTAKRDITQARDLLKEAADLAGQIDGRTHTLANARQVRRHLGA